VGKYFKYDYTVLKFCNVFAFFEETSSELKTGGSSIHLSKTLAIYNNKQ
jgi:hypothetical protein